MKSSNQRPFASYTTASFRFMIRRRSRCSTSWMHSEQSRFLSEVPLRVECHKGRLSVVRTQRLPKCTPGYPEVLFRTSILECLSRAACATRCSHRTHIAHSSSASQSRNMGEYRRSHHSPGFTNAWCSSCTQYSMVSSMYDPH